MSDQEHLAACGLWAVSGPVLGPFESYLTMRGIKTFPLRMERQYARMPVESPVARFPAGVKARVLSGGSEASGAAVERLFTKDCRARSSASIGRRGKEGVFR